MSITREFLRHPLATAAVVASSARLAEAMTTDVGLAQARSVVELGPGTGAFTRAVLAQLPSARQLLTVEINPRLAAIMRASYPEVRVVEGSAEGLAGYLSAPVDVVVSGLPWTAMPPARQDRILGAVTSVLSPHGRFTAVAYAHTAWTPPARRFHDLLRTRFAVVERSPVVWRNVPPAFVYRASLPVARDERREGAAVA